jgi:hypothetical protein
MLISKSSTEKGQVIRVHEQESIEDTQEKDQASQPDMDHAVNGGILRVLELLMVQEANGELRQDESNDNVTDDLVI